MSGADFNCDWDIMYARVYQRALAYVGDREIAKDFVQRAILRALEKGKKLEENNATAAAVFQALDEIVRNLLRRRPDKYRPPFVSIEEPFGHPIVDGEAHLYAALAFSDLGKLLSPEAQKLIFLRLHGYENKEVATMLGISEHAVKRKMGAALKRSRDLADQRIEP